MTLMSPSLSGLRQGPHEGSAREAGMTGAVVCNPSQPLRFISTASAGWGNRIGWLLTAAAIAEALNKSAIYTYWRPALLKGHCCNYDVAELHKLVSFPRVIRFLDREADFEPRRPWRLLEAVPTTTLPHPVKNAKNNLVRCSKGRSCAPPTVYSYRKALPKTTRHACLACLHLLSTSHAGVVASSRVLSRGLCLPCRRQRLHPRAGLDHMWDEMASEGCFPTCGVTRATFLAKYRSVYAQLRPRTSVQHVERPSSMSGALPPWGIRAAVGCLPLRG